MREAAMYETHGWFVLESTPGDTDTPELERLVRATQQKIETISSGNPRLLLLPPVNGSHHLIVSGLTNHREPSSEVVFEILRLLVELGKGSYGVLYVRDDEDPEGFANGFRVWVLKRGTMSVREDAFLTPCVPGIEDP
jgi:Immunity protein 7